MTQRAESTVREYYDALRSGDPLAPYFRANESTVKFGISEKLLGYDEVADALREQTETTADWTVESSNLVVAERDACATFADEVTMAWTDADTGERRRFQTRWTGTLVPNASESSDGEPSGDARRESTESGWIFVSMHVSTADDV